MFNGMILIGKRVVPTKLLMACNAAAWVVFLAEPAYAYVDPGTGSMMVQMIIAGAAAGFTTIGLYWPRAGTSTR